MITPAQSRAARALLAMSQVKLAKLAELGLSSVRDFETDNRAVSADIVAAITSALNRAGVEFADGGVRPKRPC
jgi:transcriptional regulator with XRE-family HTH domain